MVKVGGLETRKVGAADGVTQEGAEGLRNGGNMVGPGTWNPVQKPTWGKTRMAGSLSNVAAGGFRPLVMSADIGSKQKGPPVA